MSLDKLPYVLKTLLDTLITENGLVSWQIYGKDQWTQVSLRFGITDIASEATNIKYKKVSPSQQKRDLQRAQENRTIKVYKEEQEIVSVADQSHDEAAKFENAPTLHDQHVGSTIQDNTSTTSPASHSKLAEALNHIDLATSQGVLDCKPEEGSVSSEEDLGGICDDCGDHLLLTANIWYKCTLCPDHDTCDTWYERDAHKHHSSQMQMFKEPDNPQDGYCNACGAQFCPQDPQSKVFNCQQCEDYAMCPNCFKRNLHLHHKQYLKQIDIQSYLSIIK